jgi:hypothetical protein
VPRPAYAIAAEKHYRETHREEINRKRREYYAKNRERCLAYGRKYWQDNPDQRKKHYERRQQRIATIPEARERRNEVARNGQFRLRQEVLKKYGEKCACCGEYRNEFLAIDHINGCSRELRKEQGGGSALYRWLKRNNFPPGYQVLCHNCNMAKGCHGYCPHQKVRA